MKRPDTVEDQEDQSSSSGDEEIQLDGDGNRRNPLNSNCTTRAGYGRGAALLRSLRDECSTCSKSCSDAVRKGT
ncbi:unnamed protein product [Schistosoma margrebowiei]|uniref:Uncharacterized protein n=1 Tax=Schistosoma margrebowiei TaxID=48269 RepID=A0A183MTK5_9TREM|nr:unnamed protein product [Schistosoma margrebowiei]